MYVLRERQREKEHWQNKWKRGLAWLHINVMRFQILLLMKSENEQTLKEHCHPYQEI